MRVKVQLNAEFSLLIPEDTFQPVVTSACVLDLSERGALLSVEVSEAIYSQLLHRPRHCKLVIIDEPRLPEKFMGKAVWIQPEGTSEKKTCKIGLFFEEMSPESLERIRQYLIHIVSPAGDSVP